MDFHYDAFISYNHNPRDLKITKMLQQKLESFRIPADVNSRTGKTKIERVFLDRGELGVAGNLSDAILSAIENTDKLIVICSPGGRESPWVEKEIKLFLANGHTKEDILTVLTDGDPKDVIPETLLYKEEEDEDGNITRVSAEPLSCDYRGNVKEANKTELPRLVAAIIGCKYDELVQRRKQYRTQQLTKLFAALAAVMVLATSYLSWSVHKIKAAYEENLIEQSKNLAIQSERALESGDRIQAIRYALDALPSEDEPGRSVVPEAVGALIRSTDMYKTPDMNWIVATCEYKNTEGRSKSSEAMICDFDVRTYGDKTYICAGYFLEGVDVWDADTGEEVISDVISKEYPDGEINNLCFADGKRFLLCERDKICCVSLDDESLLWTYYIPEQGSAVDIRTFNDQVWIIYGNYTDGSWHLIRIGLEDGTLVREYSIENCPYDLNFSGDGSVLFYSNNQEDENSKAVPDDVYTISPDAEAPVKIGTFPCVTDLGFTEDGDILVYGFAKKSDKIVLSNGSKKDASSGKRLSSITSKKKTALLRCISPDGSLKWETEIKGFFAGSPRVTLAGGMETRPGLISCTTGETLTYLDKSGKIVEQVDFASSVIAYSQQDDSKVIEAILVDGGFASYDLEEKTLDEYPGTYHGTITSAKACNGSIYVVSMISGSIFDSGRILRYRTGGSDSKWKGFSEIDDEFINSNLVYPCTNDGTLSIMRHRTEITEDSSDHRFFRDFLTFDISSGELISERTLEIEWASDYIGTDDSTGNYYEAEITEKWVPDNSGHGNSVCSVIVYEYEADGLGYETHKAEIPSGASFSGSYYLIDTMTGCKDGKLYIGATKYDPSDGEDRFCLLTVDTSTWSVKETVCKKESAGYYYDFITFFSSIDTAHERIIHIEGSKVIMWGFDGKIKSVLPDAGFEPLCAGVSDNGDFYLVEFFKSGNILHVYDKNWKEKSTIEIGSVGEQYAIKLPLEVFELPGGEKILRDSYSSVMMASDLSGIYTDMSRFLGYDSTTGMIILGTSNGQIGSVPYRSLDEMIAEGHEIAGDN